MTWFKRIVVVLTWAMVLVGGIFALLSSQSLRESRPILGYQLHIHTPENQHFLIKEDLENLLREAGAPWDSVTRAEINIPLLEENLRKHPLVLGAEVFSTWEGVLHVEIVQKEAKARMANGLDMMYVDESGGTFPLSAHATARLPLLTGLEDSLQRVEALQMLATQPRIRPSPEVGLPWTAMTVAATPLTPIGTLMRSAGGRPPDLMKKPTRLTPSMPNCSRPNPWIACAGWMCALPAKLFMNLSIDP